MVATNTKNMEDILKLYNYLLGDKYHGGLIYASNNARVFACGGSDTRCTDFASGNLEIKDVSLLKFNKNARKKIRVIGVVCILIATIFYVGNLIWPDIFRLQDLISNFPEFD